MGTKILFLVPYPLKKAPSQRFRFEQYFSLLEKHGFQFQVSTFLERPDMQLFSLPGNEFKKGLMLLRGFTIRLRDILRAPFFDFIFIHRETCPIGPPVFEWILRYIMKRKIIFDFDDAIWLTDKVNESAFERLVKWRNKVEQICRWSYKVSCSNDYLYQYASALNKSIVYLPTTVDTESVHNRDLYKVEKRDRLTIGWTGSHSTLKYLQTIEKVITEIQLHDPRIDFLVIADHKPSLSVPSLRYIKWDDKTEIQDLLQIDIGIMPLPDDEWTRGKSGFKCLQYMALEIPTVASDVGTNSKIIDHGSNGFLARNSEEWKIHLLALIKDKNLRKTIGEAGRKKIYLNYSIAANSESFLRLFR